MRFPFSRGGIAFIHDLVMAALSLPLSLWLRLGNHLPRILGHGGLAETTALFVAVAGTVFLAMRLYRGIWRYASVNDLVALVRAVTLVILAFVPILFLVTRLEDFPRSLPIINWFVLIALLGGPRFLYRLAKDRSLAGMGGGARRVPALLAGDGDGAELFIRAMRGATAGYRVAGILSRDGGRVGRVMHGIEVLGTFDQMPAVVAKLAERGLVARTSGADRRTYGRRHGAPPARCRRRGGHDIGAPARTQRIEERHRSCGRGRTGGGGGSARPAPGGARPRRHARPDQGPARAGHRRRRVDRLGTGAPDRRCRAGGARPVREQRIRALYHRPGDRRAPSGAGARGPDRRCARPDTGGADAGRLRP